MPHVLDLLVQVRPRRAGPPRRSPRRAPGRAACRPRSGRLPLCILSARTVATSTAASGRSPEARHLMLKNFSAPMSAPKPASVTTKSLVARAIRSARIELLPWAMLANGPQWTNAGACSRVCSRFGLIASLEQDGHRAGDLEVLGGDGLAVLVVADDDPAERARAGRCRSRGQGEDGHDLGRHGDVEAGLAREAVLRPPRPTTMSRSARSLMSTTRGQSDRDGVDAERVAVVDVVVDERRRQVVGAADRVDVAGQVEVEVLHRDHLAVAAAGGAALDAEDRAHRGLADARRRPACRCG